MIIYELLGVILSNRNLAFLAISRRHQPLGLFLP
ncbi:hypothetical protein SPLC1_S533560 [Arthrospira platensis C1]|nr:hypothetical protein SPLC1_S533560 [Arthrospira platensis C1]